MTQNPLPTGATLRALLNNKDKSATHLRDVIFALRELVDLPKNAWTTEQKEWWSKANIHMGMVKGDLDNE